MTNAVSWANANQQKTLGVAGAVVGALALIVFVAYQYNKNRETAWERLAFAQSYFYQGQGDKSIEQLKEIETQFAQTPASGFSTLFAGDVLFRSGKYKEAAQTYQRLIERNRPPAAAPLALSGLAAAQEAAGDCKSSMDSANQFLREHQDHFLAPQVHATLARCQESLGMKDLAKATYERMVVLYPESYWAQWAKSRNK
ncbi:MAG: tetratricopeptide repeat protein [Elusimicrobia bacterium]|nr:tetratricopeptide repeat protein [Elusimicrobiota bacterium]